MEAREETKEEMVAGQYGGCIIPIEHGGIICSKNHHICPECAPDYISVILENHDTLIPAKCCDQTGDGKIEFDDLECYMSEDQVLDYNIYASQNNVYSNEK